ncbi:hypothetical protein EV426DRAFT_717019 [Tirmania nivea]|nr:hypothetical protein EV426DRAFT_717019 [Tirmania nivea]
MGNAGSSSSAPGLTTATKTCYYELLGVERSAPQEEIKKAYKRKALELHPDRNYNDVERATRLFAEVQAAYEVLSDPQERAWYDSHRDSILHGGDPHTGGRGGSTTPEEILSWFRLFPSKSKTDYSDSASGFYTVLSTTFAKLADEERSAAVEQGLEEPWLPSFGGSKSGYDDHVRGFYQCWTCFKTVKDFAWYDIYRLSDAPDRRIRRAMEKENDRLRHEAKREYEDNVREFVQFVRKRDPRYTTHIPKTEAERQAENLARSREQAARARAANTAAQKEYKPANWTQVVPEKDGLYDSECSEGEEEVLVFECVACRKAFKTEGQMGAHEKSKKHKQAVFQLKKKLEKEDRDLGLSAEVSEEEGEEEEEGKEGHVGGERLDGSKDTRGGEVKEERRVVVAREGGEEKTSSTNSSAEQASKKAEDEAEEEGEEGKEGKEDGSEEAEDSDYVSTSTFHARVFGSTTPMTGESGNETVGSSNLATTLAGTTLDEKKPQPQPPKIGKAKAKREKKKAAAAAASGAGPSVNEHTCAVCKEQFTSKTKMFNHLKENPSHVAAPSQVKGNAGGVGAKKSKGKKN